MSSAPLVKICGLREEETLSAALEAGADFIGLVFYPPSPRSVDSGAAKNLAEIVKGYCVSKKVSTVGLFVDPSDQTLEEVLGRVAPDMIQLHGSETPERVRVVGEIYNLPVIKALPVTPALDFNLVAAYDAVSDWLLFDAKPVDSNLPGGTGKTFDWGLLEGRRFSKPWMLSGGLNVDNIAEALGVLRPDAVDVSSGVESVRGVKDSAKIKEFINKIKLLS